MDEKEKYSLPSRSEDMARERAVQVSSAKEEINIQPENSCLK
jgi:hypothetical protein